MDVIFDICLMVSVISLNVFLWVNWYTNRLSKPSEKGGDMPKMPANEQDEEMAKKEKLAKEWANMMSYDGTKQGGDD